MNNKRRKINKTLIFVIAIAAAVLLGILVVEPVANSIRSNTEAIETATVETTEATAEATEPVTEARKTFDEIFSDNSITNKPVLENKGKVATFAKELELGTIEVLEYRYEDDLVIEMADTVYTPFYNFTDAQKKDTEESMRKQFDVYDKLDCCQVTYEMNYGYFIVTLRYTDLDVAENLIKIEEAEAPFMCDPSEGFISMKTCEQYLTKRGYSKQ